MESAEDILVDPTSILYSAEVNKALTPAREILCNILASPNEDPGEYVPAKAWLEAQGKDVDEIIPYVGTLSVIERAQIANWFETHVGLTKEARVLGSLDDSPPNRSCAHCFYRLSNTQGPSLQDVADPGFVLQGLGSTAHWNPDHTEGS